MKHLRTIAVHAGERAPRPDFHPVTTPIYASVAFSYETMDELDAVFANARPGYVYTRYGNPTVSAFEQAVAALERGEAAVAYATGMAAVHGALLGAGACQETRVVAAADLYGASYSLLDKLFRTLGVETTFVRIDHLDEVAEAVRRTKPVALFCETISNPLLRLADLSTLAEMAHAEGALLIVDNTFASPYLVQPIALGADVVIHSATKYLGGHGDVMGGVVVCSAALAVTLRDQQKITGATLGPFEAWLLLRGLKTLPLRVREQCANALAIAEHLAAHPKVARVNYPGLVSHPQHALGERLFEGRGYGGVLSFELVQGNRANVFRFMEALRLIQPATTLGDVYSLVLYPAHSSHRQVPPEIRAQIGIGEGLIRLSAGIEETADLLADLDQALSTI